MTDSELEAERRRADEILAEIDRRNQLEAEMKSDADGSEMPPDLEAMLAGTNPIERAAILTAYGVSEGDVLAAGSPVPYPLTTEWAGPIIEP